VAREVGGTPGSPSRTTKNILFSWQIQYGLSIWIPSFDGMAGERGVLVLPTLRDWNSKPRIKAKIEIATSALGSTRNDKGEKGFGFTCLTH
jgi:hypothetical protein